MRAGSLYNEYSEIHQKWFGSPAPNLKPYLSRK